MSCRSRGAHLAVAVEHRVGAVLLDLQRGRGSVSQLHPLLNSDGERVSADFNI